MQAGTRQLYFRVLGHFRPYTGIAVITLLAMAVAAATDVVLIAQLKVPQPKEAKFSLDIDAAQALEAIGPAAKEAVPALLARIKQGPSRGYCLAAADAVLALQGPRVEATWGLVAEYNPTCGGASLFVSRSAKYHPAETVRHLIELTRDDNPLIREYAIDIPKSQRWPCQAHP